MAHTTDSVIRIIDAGANVDVAGGKTAESYIKIAQAAVRKGVNATIDGGSLTTESLVRIAQAGGKSVTIKCG